MPSVEADLSILRPFTPEDIGRYVSFLRQNGATLVAAAVEAAASRELAAGRQGVSDSPRPS